MWILILTISLKSQFAHNRILDVKIVDNLNSNEECINVGTLMTEDLKYFNHEVQTKIRCENDYVRKYK